MGPDRRTEPLAGPRYAMNLSETDVGCRVVVRRTVPGGLSDLLGILTAWDTDGLTVQTDRGPVDVRAPEVVAGKRIPDRPVRP